MSAARLPPLMGRGYPDQAVPTGGQAACFSLSHKPRPGLRHRKIYGCLRTNALDIGAKWVAAPFVRQAGLCIASAGRDHPLLPHTARQPRRGGRYS